MTTDKPNEPIAQYGWRCPNCNSMNEPWAGSCVCGTGRQMIDGSWVYTEPKKAEGTHDYNYKGEIIN